MVQTLSPHSLSRLSGCPSAPSWLPSYLLSEQVYRETTEMLRSSVNKQAASSSLSLMGLNVGGESRNRQQPPPQQHCRKASNSGNSDTGRVTPTCLLAQDVGHLCLSLGSRDIQAQFGDSSPTLHTKMHFSCLSKLREFGRKEIRRTALWGQRTACKRAYSTGYNRNQKKSFFSSKQSISYHNFPAFVKISFQTGKDSGRVP